MNSSGDYYQILGVDQAAPFPALKQAYYRRAKECHPDRFAGDPGKEEEFKQLVEAFDVLSDPLRRREYDTRQQALVKEVFTPGETWLDFGFDEEPILDSFADDVLEELIVGIVIPKNTTLRTLMLDLERTEKFCLFREAKNYFYSRELRKALLSFQKAVAGSPHNILYRYFLAKSYCLRGQWAAGAKELETGIRLGALRRPPLHLVRFQRDLGEIRRRHQGFLSRWIYRLTQPVLTEAESAETKARRQLLREMNRQALEERKKRHLLK